MAIIGAGISRVKNRRRARRIRLLAASHWGYVINEHPDCFNDIYSIMCIQYDYYKVFEFGWKDRNISYFYNIFKSNVFYIF